MSEEPNHRRIVRELQAVVKEPEKLSERAQKAISGLDAGKRALVEEKLKEIPFSARGGYVRAVTGKSLRVGINAFCCECTGWNRIEVRNCTSPTCPLYNCRPFQGKGK